MADRPQQLLDAYAGRSAGDDAGNSIGTVGDLAPLAIEAVRDVLRLHIVVRPGGTCRACTFRWPCATVRMITTALEAP